MATSESIHVGVKTSIRPTTFPAQHIVTGVRDWRSGMRKRSRCGVVVDVQERLADDSKEQLCERCRRSLGWHRSHN